LKGGFASTCWHATHVVLVWSLPFLSLQDLRPLSVQLIGLTSFPHHNSQYQFIEHHNQQQQTRAISSQMLCRRDRRRIST
jgi:hypothetical protein